MAANEKAPITVAAQNHKESLRRPLWGDRTCAAGSHRTPQQEQSRCSHRCCMEMESRFRFHAIQNYEPHFTTTWPVIFGWTEQ
jgi:hypothetical protein